MNDYFGRHRLIGPEWEPSDSGRRQPCGCERPRPGGPQAWACKTHLRLFVVYWARGTYVPRHAVAVHSGA